MELSHWFFSEEFCLVMTIDLAVDILRQTLTLTLLVLAPILVITIVVGVVISLLQSVTSIQEQTLTFVPKLVAVAVVIIIFSNWMILQVMEFATRNYDLMSQLSP